MMNIYIFYSMITSGLPYDNIMWNNNKSQFTKISFWHTEKTHRKKNGNFVLFIFVNDSSHRLFFYLINNFFFCYVLDFFVVFYHSMSFYYYYCGKSRFFCVFFGENRDKKRKQNKNFCRKSLALLLLCHPASNRGGNQVSDDATFLIICEENISLWFIMCDYNVCVCVCFWRELRSCVKLCGIAN